jgi:hypothetical protein
MTPLEGKYTKWYYSIIFSAKANHTKDVYTERHHIIPRSLGGSDDDDNLVDLTAKQHFICHLLLTKMFEVGSFEYYKMIHAFCMMDWKCNNSNMLRYTGKVYEAQRREFSEYMSMKQTGSGNNQFGTRWVYNEDLKLCKKILKDEEIPEGWLQGRILNWDAYFAKKMARRCPHCDQIITTSRHKYCSTECSNAFKLISREGVSKLKTSDNNLSTSSRKMPQFICKSCGNIYFAKNNRNKNFCSTKCSNSYRFIFAKTITLYKDGEAKIVKAQNAPAYKKWGWHTLRNSNPQPTD